MLAFTWGAMIIPLLVLNWTGWTNPHRSVRVSLRNAIISGVFGLIVTAIFGGALELGIAIPAGLALASGVLFPWTSGSTTPGTAAGGIPAALIQPHREPG